MIAVSFCTKTPAVFQKGGRLNDEEDEAKRVFPTFSNSLKGMATKNFPQTPIFLPCGPPQTPRLDPPGISAAFSVHYAVRPQYNGHL